MAGITFDRVTKVYADGTRAVSELELAIHDGELIVFVGPSGCGKTTALRMIAGLEEITEGSLLIGERLVNDLPPRERDLAMVFQSYALYPHLTVLDNIAFGLRLRKTPKHEVRERVTAVATKLGLSDLLARKPRTLSGGQRQRVAMGRAIVRQPNAFLMDEPLSNLDARLRVEMRAEIIRLQRELRATMVYVTHDQVEAMTMGDRVAVLRKGVLQQVAPPEDLYRHPVNLFVATFIGNPTMNALEGRLDEQDGVIYVAIGSLRVQLDHETLAARPALRGYCNRQLIVGIRPEHLEGASAANGFTSSARLHGRVELREPLGSDVLAHVAVDAAAARNEDMVELEADTTARARSPGGNRTSIVCRLDADSRAAEGQTIDLMVEPGKFYFFDRDTGVAIER